EESLPPYSVFTWPFRLTLNHSREARRRDGQYPRDLDERVDAYLERLLVRRSLVFFYLNYDNPISADEYKYALVGCAVLTDYERTGEFDFDEAEKKKVRSAVGMQNFPTRNWSVRLSYDYPNTGVRLPYHEYLDHVEKNPNDEGKLEEIKVLIDEPALVPGFKYVSEQIHNDQAL